MEWMSKEELQKIKDQKGEWEFGSSMPIRFLGPENISAYNSDGKEIIIPKCDKCQSFKSEIIGKTYWMWFCPSCGN
jgi:hypothetical protein